MKLLERVFIAFLTFLAAGKLEPAFAGNYEISRSCLDAINQTELKIHSVGVEATINFSDMRESNISGYPDGKPFKISFAISAYNPHQYWLNESLMRSTKMLLNISGDLIQKCDGVSLVDFGLNHTDYIKEFLLVDGTVRPMTCTNQFIEGASMPWGFSGDLTCVTP